MLANGKFPARKSDTFHSKQLCNKGRLDALQNSGILPLGGAVADVKGGYMVSY